jgi:hypothetical protein
MTEDEALAHARGYARRTVALVDAAHEPDVVTVGATPCEGPDGTPRHDRFFVTARVQVPLAPERQRATLQLLRAEWLRRGYRITHERDRPELPGGQLDARNPADGYQLALTTTQPPTALAVSVYSPAVPIAPDGPRPRYW